MNTITQSEVDFISYLQKTDAKANVKPATQWTAELIERLKNPQREKQVLLPWEKTRGLFNFRQGEVTLWTGQNGHGKSLVTGQVALNLIHQKQKVCIASFEMKPITTLQRMARQFCGTNPYSEAYQGNDGIGTLEGLYQGFNDFSKDGLWLYDQQGQADAMAIAGMVKYCAIELGMNHVFIDSLMRCVKGEDDYNGQKEFVGLLCSLALDYGIHIHLVHHTRKPKDESHMPDKHDNKGSGAITDQVDNVMMVWRNKVKEEAFKSGKSQAQDEPDAIVFCRKQRNGDDEPSIRLWFHKDSSQFLGNNGDQPFVYINESGQWTP